MPLEVDDPDDLSWDLEEEGRLVRRQLDRRVVTAGGWATAVYLFQEIDPATDGWRAPRAAIVRFRKVGGRWRKHASINVGSPAAADAISGALAAWFGPAGAAAASDQSDD